MKYSKEDKQTAEKMLRKFLGKSPVVYTILRSVSKSGMSRRIDLYTIDKSDNTLQYLSGWAATFMGWSIDARRGGIRVGGCGMDMGFHLVYSLSSCLFRAKNGSYSHDGAYLLKHEWL